MPIKMPARRPSPEEFIAGATAASPTLPSELPWLHPRVRDDLRVQVNAKLPEKLMVQVHWLANRLGVKKQDVLESALRAWVADEMRKLGLPED